MYRFLRPGILALAGLAAALLARGQITEVPATVAPGSFLLEMDALSLSVDREAGSKYTAFGAASTFLTTGLTDSWDIQLGADLFISQKFDSGGLSERHSGIGDVYARTKWRFYDDPATGTAVAVMPYVKLPTSTGGVGSDAMEGGIIVPWTTKLPGAFEMSAMAELDFTRNAADDGYDTFWYASAFISRPLTRALGVYAEAAVGKSSGGEPLDGILGAGATLAVTEHVSWDYAVYKGISNGASDWSHVLRVNISF